MEEKSRQWKRGCTVDKWLESLSWNAAQKRSEIKYLPELSLEAGNADMGGGDLAIGLHSHMQGLYSWECTKALLKILKYYSLTHTHTHSLTQFKRLMTSLVEASRILLQHSSTTDWVASMLTRCTHTEYLSCIYRQKSFIPTMTSS